MNTATEQINHKFDEAYAKWRNRILNTNRYLVFIIFAAEFFMFFVLNSEDLILIPIPVYLLRYLLLPTVINGAVLVTGSAVLDKKPGDWKWINYVPIIQQILVCTVVASVHCMFRVTLGIYCIPIMLTIIFNDKRMSRSISFISILGLLIVCLYRYFWGNFVYEDIYLITEAMVTVIIIFCTNVVCGILIEFHQEKNTVIECNYRKELELQEQLGRDQKTGLFSAPVFLNMLFQYVDEAEQLKKPFTLVMIDIDNFKSINDAYGHAKGDIVIKGLSEYLENYFAGNGIVSRFGGEEFTVIIKESDGIVIENILEECRKEIESRTYDFMSQGITVSIGYAIWQEGFTDTFLFELADRAMYDAKRNGKNRIANGNRIAQAEENNGFAVQGI